MSLKHILVVDDSEMIRKMIISLLFQNGFSADEAETCEIASKKIKQRKPDLIILDVELPDIYGTDFCAQLKQNSETRYIPIILCTGTAKNTQDKIHGLDHGADDYILKPFDIREMISRVHSLLRRVDLGVELAGKKQIKSDELLKTVSYEPAVDPSSLQEVSFLKLFGTLLIAPKIAFTYFKFQKSSHLIQLLGWTLLTLSFFSGFPQLMRGEYSETLKSSLLTLIRSGVWIILSVLLFKLCFKFFLKKQIPWVELMGILTLSFFPFVLKELLAGIYVLSLGYPAQTEQFSAGLLFWMTTSSKFQHLVFKLMDIFPLWFIFLGSLGCSVRMSVPNKKVFPLILLCTGITLSLMTLL